MGTISIQGGGGAGAAGANKALSNLANTAVNADIIPATDDTIEIGSVAKQIKNMETKKVTYGVHAIEADTEDNDGVKIIQCFHAHTAGDGTAGNFCLHEGTEPPESVSAQAGHRLWVDASGVLRHQKPDSGGAINLDAGGVTAVREQVNILLNAFRLDLAKFELMDGMTDAFVSEAGVDTADSTNESYDSGSNLYNPTETGTVVWNPTLDADGSFADFSIRIVIEAAGISTGGTTLKVTLRSGSIEGLNVDLVYVGQKAASGDQWDMATSPAPVEVKFGGTSGVNIPANSTVESDLTTFTVDETKGLTIAMDIGSNSSADMLRNKVTVANVESYQKAGSNEAATANVSGFSTSEDNLAVDQIEVFAGVNNMTLISEATEAEANPDEVRVVVFEEDVDAVTVNTDLKAYASRDDGANWVQATLTDKGDYEAGKQILTGTADLSGQASDKTVRYKIETLNNKDLNLHGVGMLWN